MEEILIKSLEEKSTAKGALLKVGYNGNRSATVAPWLKEIITFIKSVGIGGSVRVVVEKQGDYNNITDCDLGEVPVEKVKETQELVKSELSLRDRNITAQCLTKVWAEMSGETTPEEILAVYSTFYKSL